MNTNFRTDTICAQATAPGHGAISVIRVSGDQSFEFTKRLCPDIRFSNESHKLYYGFLKDPNTKEDIDEVIISYFANGRSFTGEESVEVSCHGSQVIVERIIQAFLDCGCEIAEPGEFTKRAFLNGRIDLVQAESVLSLIQSRNKSAAQAALRQLKGSLSKEFQDLESEILWLLSRLELTIDFTTEDVSAASINELKEHIERADLICESLNNRYRSGEIVLHGLRVGFIGSPNVGKSSLFNALLSKERAIVTDVPGTTRDILEDTLRIKGIEVVLVDTAGLRESSDVVEIAGIERTRKSLGEADILFYVIDLSDDLDVSLLKEIEEQHYQKLILVCNKWDKSIFKKEDLSMALKQEVKSLNIKSSELEKLIGRSKVVSASTGYGIEKLLEVLKNEVDTLDLEEIPGLIQKRHFDLLTKIKDSLKTAEKLITSDASPELATMELHNCRACVYRILGLEIDDQIMDKVFSEFCIGK